MSRNSYSRDQSMLARADHDNLPFPDQVYLTNLDSSNEFDEMNDVVSHDLQHKLKLVGSDLF